MAIMVTGTVLNKSLIALAISSISAISFGGELKLTPSAKIDGIYTDNVELVEQERTDSYVMQYGVLLDIEYEAQYANFKLESESIYATYSHDNDLNDDYHSVAADFNVMLWPNGISFYSQANVRNESRNRSKNSLADIVSGDLARVEDYITGLSYDLNNSDFELNINAAHINTKAEDGYGEREGFQHSLTSANGSGAEHIFWDLQSNFQDLDNGNRSAKYYQAELKLGWITGVNFNPFLRYYDEDNEGDLNENRSLESNSYGLGFRWLVTPRLYVDLSYNNPIADDQTNLEGEALEEYYDINANWQPSTRTTLQLGASQRFFGNSYSFNFRHRIRRIENTISYSEEVRAFTRSNYQQFLVGNYWCPVSDNAILSDCFVQDNQTIDFDNYQLISVTDFNIIEDDGYRLNKSLDLATSILLPRGSFDIKLNNSRNFNLDNDVEDRYQYASISYKRRISGKSNLLINASYSENVFFKDQENERIDKYRKLDIEYSKSINSKLETKLGFSRLERESNTEFLSYDEQRVYLQVVKEF